MTAGQKKDFLDFPRKFMNGSGLGPESPKYKKYISLCLLLPSALIVDFFVGLAYFSKDNDIFRYAELMESTSSFGQLLIRKFILTVHSKLIREIFHERKHFWSYDMFGEDYGKFLTKKMALGRNIARIMIGFGAIIAALMCLSVLLDPSKKVPLLMWTPENNAFSRILYLMQSCALAEIIYLVGAVDAFYILMCIELKIQLLLLQRKLKSLINKSDFFEELTICTVHHNLIVRVHKKLNATFSEYFLVQYAVSVLSASVQLYIIMYIKPNLQDVIRSIITISSVFFNVAMFFIPASDIEIEAEILTDAIYKVNWENTTDHRIKKHLIFMLMNAQKPLVMLGGGMFHANRNEYIMLFRLAFSIATILGEGTKIN